jgi:long-subunit fatty acid transport protein
MKKMKLLLLAMLVSSPVLYAGGLITNTNQSAAWSRMLSRHAAYGIDAVYFNPAGLGLLGNGFHMSVSNQTIAQTQQITSSYEYITGAPKMYEGTVSAPLFPSIYAAFKMDKWAFSAGVNVIGGGGGADFAAGLPAFEIPVASLIPLLQGNLLPLDQGIEQATGWNPGYSNIAGYDMNMAFNGSSMYLGYQVGATYAINDLISVAVGARYVMANNTYEGSLSGVIIDAPYGGWQSPGDYVRRVASNPALPVETAELLNNTAAAIDAQTGDAELNSTQKGTGITPVIGLNLHLSDMLNVAVKYEHHTKIELTNDTEVDDVNMFPDGAKTRADLPGMIAGGVQLKPIRKLTANAGFNYYLDKGAYYGNYETDADGLPVMAEDGISYVQINNESTIDKNMFEVSAGIEYMIIDLLGISAGFSYAQSGINDSYQSDLSYSLNSNTVAGGIVINPLKRLAINAGIVYVMYKDADVQRSYSLGGNMFDYSTNYLKNTILFAVGVDFSLGGK